jgi:SagB-type dehydrogenase family enzyme
MRSIKHLIIKPIALFIFVLVVSFTDPYHQYTFESSNFNPQIESMIKLPEPKLSSETSVEESMQNRRSVRDFLNEPISLEQASQLLWAAYGITENRANPAFLRGGLRTTPSAGALYPLEVYLVVGKVTGLKAGIYKYIPEGHQLELVSEGDVRKNLAEAALEQEFIEQAPASIVYTAIYKRTTQKYGERGRDRYVCMDLGHSAQNVYLQAYAINLGTCAVGAFTDKMVSMVMLLPDNEEPLYIMPIGKY